MARRSSRGTARADRPCPDKALLVGLADWATTSCYRQRCGPIHSNRSSVGGKCWNAHMFESVQRLFRDLLDSGAPEPTTSEAQPRGTAAAPAPDRLTARQLLDRIAAAERLVHALQAAQRQDIAAFARARLAADDDLSMVGSRLRGRTVGTELALALNTSPTAGASRAALAATATEDHPALSALAEHGELSGYALRLVTRETEVLPPAQRRLVDAQLADNVVNAGGLTPGRLRQAAARRTIAVDPYAATRRCDAARNDRAFGVMDPRDGTATLWARLRAEEALTVHQCIDTTARRLRAEGDERSLANLRCDLLVQATTGAEPSNVLPSSLGAWAPDSPFRSHPHSAAMRLDASPSRPAESPPRDEDPHLAEAAWDSYPFTDSPHDVADPVHAVDKDPTRQPAPMPVPAKVELQIVLAASTLLGLDQEPASLRGYGALPVPIVAQILDAANGADRDPGYGGCTDTRSSCPSGSGTGVLVRRLLCDPVDGRLIGMDAKTRRYTGPLRQFTAWRDQGCRLSDAPIADIDHIARYVDGGPTTAANGQGLSKNTHVLRDHPQVSVRTMPPQHGVVTQRARSADESSIDRALDPRSQQLSRLRESAPDVEWTMPTGHTYLRRPPPALGRGSGSTSHDPPGPPDAQTAERLAAKSARALRRELAKRRRRLARRMRKEKVRRQRRIRAHLERPD